MGDDGHHHVEVELAALGCERDGRVVADDLEADHVEHLGHDGVDFARHDGRSRLHRRERNLGESGARSGAEQAQIVGDLGQVEREGTQRR